MLVAGLFAGPAVLVRAADEKPAPEKKAAKKEGKPKQVRLTKPWNTITSLTEEQKTQIADLHKKSLEEQKQAQQREKDAIMAVLNDQQKAEIKALEEKEAADRKMKKGPEKSAEKSADSSKPAEK